MCVCVCVRWWAYLEVYDQSALEVQQRGGLGVVNLQLVETVLQGHVYVVCLFMLTTDKHYQVKSQRETEGEGATSNNYTCIKLLQNKYSCSCLNKICLATFGSI